LKLKRPKICIHFGTSKLPSVFAQQYTLYGTPRPAGKTLPEMFFTDGGKNENIERDETCAWLEQWFPTVVPRYTRVSFVGARVATNSLNFKPNN